MSIDEKLTYLWFTFTDWLHDHTPVTCARCGFWIWRKDAWAALHRVCGNTNLCARCYRELYFPYEKEVR